MRLEENRHTRRYLALGIAMAMLGAFVTPTQAQDVELNRVHLNHYRPAPPAEDGFAVSTPNGRTGFGLNVQIDYANDPLVYEDTIGDAESESFAVVSDQLTLHLGANYGIDDFLTIYGGLPVTLLMGGDDPADAASLGTDIQGLATDRGFGIGDLYLGARLALVGEGEGRFDGEVDEDQEPRYDEDGNRIDNRGDDTFNLGLQLHLNIPLADILAGEDTTNLWGNPGLTIHPQLLMEIRAGVAITANIGVDLRLHDTVQLRNIPIGTELTFGLGFTIPITDGLRQGLDVHVEAFGRTGFASGGDLPNGDEDTGGFFGRVTTPVELLLGLKYRTPDGITLGLAGSTGINRGYGSPDFRLIGMFGIAGAHEEEIIEECLDDDNDGICNTADRCPQEAEDFDQNQDEDGCPEEESEGDRDGDGILDTDDQCPDEAEDQDSFEDANGCPDPDNDADGILDTADECPMEPEDMDQFEDENGCPDPDNDADGIIDANDQCPLEAEDMDNYHDTDGCPEPDNDNDGVPDAEDQCPMTPAGENPDPARPGCNTLVQRTAEGIQILQKVEFATSSDQILARSEPLLQAVHAVIAADSDILVVRVEGHTDARGRDRANLELSQRRARSVVNRLTELGIAASRLTAFGCGENMPIADNNRRAGRQENRRVEFHITNPPPPADHSRTVPEGACVAAQ